MVTKVKRMLSTIRRHVEWDDFGLGVLCGGFFMLCLVIGGCNSKSTPNALATASITPQPITGTSMIILDDGQSAMLHEDVIAKAVVPYSGDPLYEGEVRFRKGSMVVKPVVVYIP